MFPVRPAFELNLQLLLHRSLRRLSARCFSVRRQLPVLVQSLGHELLSSKQQTVREQLVNTEQHLAAEEPDISLKTANRERKLDSPSSGDTNTSPQTRYSVRQTWSFWKVHFVLF